MHKAKSWAELYATKVKPEEILYVVTNMARIHEEGKNPGFETAMFIVVDRYKKKKHAQGKSLAIIERLRCLAKLIEQKDERLRGWTMQGIEEGCLLTNHAVFTAAALCPMKRGSGDNDHYYFDPNEFFDICLRESDSEGKA
jgi:hypothetical protein